MRAVLLAVACALLGSFSASAQQPAAEPIPVRAEALARSADRIELTLLGGLFGGGTLGETEATVLTNDVPTSGQTPLFKTRSSISHAPAIEGRLGVRLTRSLWVEGGLSYAEPSLDVEITGDMEGAANVTAAAPLSQFIADVGLQYRWSGRRVSPFVQGGGGYLRQLDAPRTSAETGSVFYGGGGVLVRLSTASSGWRSHVSARGDARLTWLRGGIHLDDERSPALVVSGGVTVGF